MVADDLEARLSDAAAAVRERELDELRSRELEQRLEDLVGRLTTLRDQHDKEQLDVQRLEGLSLTSVLAALRGSRDARLDRERAQRDAAALRYREVETAIAAVRHEHDAVQARLERSDALAVYAAVIDEKERHLAGSDDPRRERLLELAAERARLTAGLQDLGQAQGAAEAAQQALRTLEDELANAAWGFGRGGGYVSTAVERFRVAEAAAAATEADRALDLLRTEVADVDRHTRFLDVWFDHALAGLGEPETITDAQTNAINVLGSVDIALGRLKQRAIDVRARLQAIEVERHTLLTSD